MTDWTPTSEGIIPFTVGSETYSTWFRVFGDINSSSNPPLVVLHGGPGLSHDYLLPLTDLSGSRAVILYDQIGNSRSTHLQDKPQSFWTINLFIDELVNLLNHFKIQDRFDLIGHSWGGILAAEFEVRRHPAASGLRYLILTNSLPDMDLWNQSNMQLAATLPKEVQEGLASPDPKVSGPATRKFFETYGTRIRPPPAEYTYSLDQGIGENADKTVPGAMFSGELKEWSIIDRLHTIRPPTLIINARYDVAQDFVTVPFFKHIPRVKWITLESCHLPMWDERERFNKVVEQFLDM